LLIESFFRLIRPHNALNHDKYQANKLTSIAALLRGQWQVSRVATKLQENPFLSFEERDVSVCLPAEKISDEKRFDV